MSFAGASPGISHRGLRPQPASGVQAKGGAVFQPPKYGLPSVLRRLGNHAAGGQAAAPGGTIKIVANMLDPDRYRPTAIRDRRFDKLKAESGVKGQPTSGWQAKRR